MLGGDGGWGVLMFFGMLVLGGIGGLVLLLHLYLSWRTTRALENLVEILRTTTETPPPQSEPSTPAKAIQASEPSPNSPSEQPELDLHPVDGAAKVEGNP